MNVAKPLLAVISQGCAANFGDGEKIARIFADDYRVVFGMPKETASGNEAEKPDAFVLNVCTVKGNAGALKLLREALSNAPEAKLFITGCAPKDFREEVAKITEKVVYTSLRELGRGMLTLPLRESSLVGIVNIEEGCLDACAYCSTRLVKGRLHSYPAADIVQQVKSLVNDGCIEIQLTGQDCGCYGFDTGTNLAELVQQILAEVPGNYKMRLGMGNPRHMLQYIDPLLECFKDERVYKFIHLPVQSGSENILKAMNRKHSADDYVMLAEAFFLKRRARLSVTSLDLWHARTRPPITWPAPFPTKSSTFVLPPLPKPSSVSQPKITPAGWVKPKLWLSKSPATARAPTSPETPPTALSPLQATRRYFRANDSPSASLPLNPSPSSPNSPKNSLNTKTARHSRAGISFLA